MDPLAADLLKIIVDKLLLGLIAVGFGYYLSRLLEDYRTRNTYRLSLLSQRNEACKSVVSIITIHHERVIELRRVLKRVIDSARPNEESMDADLKVGEEYIQSHAKLLTQISPYLPHLSFSIAEALNSYIDKANAVSGIVVGKTKLEDFPTEEKINEALMRLLVAYHETIISDAYPAKINEE